MSNLNLNFSKISATLAPIKKPSACARVTDVFNFNGYEKTLCYVKRKSSYFNSQTTCKKLGGKLYKVESSAASSKAIRLFVKAALGGSSRAAVFVDGFKNKKCMTYSGNGKTNYVSCQTTYNFICEYNNTG